MSQPIAYSQKGNIQIKLDLTALNRLFAGMSAQERLRRLYDYFPANDILVTSSFGASSAILLKHISLHAPQQAVYFIDTRYHFPETLAYKEQLIQQLGLQVLDIRPQEEGYAFTLANETWKSAPDLCCQINKVSPLEAVKHRYNIWISGLMSYQSPTRKNTQIFEEKDGIVKFHPLVDWSAEDVASFMNVHALPEHPLQQQGYQSIGCLHCTAKGEGREGRWQGTGKKECGLHL